AEKYRQGDFGRCPRTLCRGVFVIPHGQNDILNEGKVRLYCPKCEDVYTPKSSRHFTMDGAFFGTTFAPFFFLSYPNLIPRQNPNDQYTPRIFGFKIHHAAKVQRLQYRFMSQDFQILSHRRLGIELPSSDTP
ncbi:casein kinase 2 regulatory subunit, partial [Massospora cicadina]